MQALIEEIEQLDAALSGIRPGRPLPRRLYLQWRRLWASAAGASFRALDEPTACKLLWVGLGCEYGGRRDYAAIVRLIEEYLAHPHAQIDAEAGEFFRTRLADAHLHLGHTETAVDLYHQALAAQERKAIAEARRSAQVLLAKYCRDRKPDEPVPESLVDLAGSIVRAYRRPALLRKLEKTSLTYAELFDLLNRLQWINWG